MHSLGWIALLFLTAPVAAEDLTGQWVTVVRHQAKVVNADGEFQRFIPIGASFAVESVRGDLVEIPSTGAAPDRVFVDAYDVQPSSKAAAFMKNRAETENSALAWLNYAVYLRRIDPSAHFESLMKASELDPLNIRLQTEVGRAFEMIRADEKAEKLYDLAETLIDASNARREPAKGWFTQDHTITYPHLGVHSWYPRHFEPVRECAQGFDVLTTAGGRAADAEKKFLEALGHDLDCIPAYCGLADAYEKQGRLDDAIDAVTEIIDRRPHDHVHLIKRAELWERRGRFDRARLDFDSAVAVAANCPCPLRERAEFHSRQKDLKASIADLGNALELDSGNPRIIDQRIRLEVSMFAYDEALADLQLLRQIEPAARHMRPLEGMLWQLKGDFSKARAVYREFGPGSWDCCRLCMRQKDFAEALKDCDAIVADQERRVANSTRTEERAAYSGLLADGRRARGYCLEQLGRLEESLADYTAWSNASPKSRLAHASRARVLKALDRDDEAAAEMAAAMDIDALTCSNLVARGLAKEGIGDFQGALDDYMAADKLHGNCGASRASIAWLRSTSPDGAMRSGKQAVEDAQRAMTFKSGPSRSKELILAAAYAEAGDFDQAIRRLQAYRHDSHVTRKLMPLVEQYRRGIPTRAEPWEAYLP